MHRTHPPDIQTIADPSKRIILNCITWNIRGWGGQQDNTKRKMGKIKGELEGYDIIVLTETHLSREKEEVDKFEKHLQDYNMHHVHDKTNSSGRKGVSIGIRKATINDNKVTFLLDEGEDDEGRWLRVTLTNVLDKPINIWGIYAPTNATERKKWMQTLGNKLQTYEGYTLVAGDFNFVMNTALDKRGGRASSGMSGRHEQSQMGTGVRHNRRVEKTQPIYSGHYMVQLSNERTDKTCQNQN